MRPPHAAAKQSKRARRIRTRYRSTRPVPDLHHMFLAELQQHLAVPAAVRLAHAGREPQKAISSGTPTLPVPAERPFTQTRKRPPATATRSLCPATRTPSRLARPTPRARGWIVTAAAPRGSTPVTCETSKWFTQEC